MNRRRPALIFDFGNVVAFFDYTRACAALASTIGLTGDALLNLLKQNGLTPVLQDYERGAISSEEFTAAVCELAGLDVPAGVFERAWSDIFWLNEPVAALVADLKARGYTLVLGSNTNALHAAQFRPQFAEALAPFDRLVLSYEVGHIKPSPAFYLACAAAAAAEPEDCVFIDDMPENVEGAVTAGLTGLHFRDMPTLLRDLRRLGVDLNVTPK